MAAKAKADTVAVPESTSQAAPGKCASAKQSSVSTAVVVLIWFVLNTTIMNLMKWLYLYGKICHRGECTYFAFPLYTTAVHMLFSWIMCLLYLFCTRTKIPNLSLENQIRKICPLAACFALSVGIGNLSLKYIYPSLGQMLGSGAPLVTVAMATCMTGTVYNRWTWGSMVIICSGLLLCAGNEVNFNAFGIICAVVSTVMRAAKSIIQGQLLTGEDRLDSVVLLCYMAPYSALMLVVMAALSEGSQPPYLLVVPLMESFNRNELTDSGAPESTGVLYTLVLLSLTGLNACLLNISNFLVTFYTSAITLQVLGNVKNCVAIGISVLIFQNPLMPSQALGMSITLYGVYIYNQRGGKAVQAKPQEAAPKEPEEAVPLLADQDGPADEGGKDVEAPQEKPAELGRPSNSSSVQRKDAKDGL